MVCSLGKNLGHVCRGMCGRGGGMEEEPRKKALRYFENCTFPLETSPLECVFHLVHKTEDSDVRVRFLLGACLLSTECKPHMRYTARLDS